MTWLREIRRSKLKFGLLAAAVGLLFFLLLFVNTLSSTLLDGFIGAIENTSADVLVFDSGSQATIPASRLTPDDVSRVTDVEGVASAAAISELTTDASLDGRELDVSVWGIEVGGPGTPSELDEGRLPEPGEAVVDTTAREAGLTIGTKVEISGVHVELVGVAVNATYSVLPTIYVDNATWGDVFIATYPQAEAVPINLVGVATTNETTPSRVAAAISDLDGLQGLAVSSPGGDDAVEHEVAVQVLDVVVDARERDHHLVELLERQRLLAVRERLVGSRVDLDHDPVGARPPRRRSPAA